MSLLENPFDIVRAIRPGEDPSPDVAARLVALAKLENPSSRPDARLDFGGHLGAMSRIRFMLERDTETALTEILMASAVAVSAKLVADDLTRDTVAFPVEIARIIDQPTNLQRESPVTYIPPGHILERALAQAHVVVIDAGRLPAGHPLLAVEPVDLGIGRTVFVGHPYLSRGRNYPGCACSLRLAEAVTKFYREAKQELDKRKAEEKRLRIVAQEKAEKEAQAAREVGGSGPRTLTG